MKPVFSYDWLEQFEALDTGVRRRIMNKLREIERANAWPHEALKGRQFEGLYKIRVGDFRIIYRILETGALDFVTLGHRSEVYRS